MNLIICHEFTPLVGIELQDMNLLMNPTDGLLEMWYATPKHLHLCYISLMCDNL